MMRTCLIAACSALLLFFQADADRDELEDRVESLFNQGDEALAQQNYSEALRVYREALEVNESLVELDPENIRTRLNFVLALQRLAMTHKRRGRVDYAIPIYEQRHRELEDLVAEKPGETRVQIAFANSFGDLAGALSEKGDFDQAQNYFEQGLEYSDRLVREHPANLDCQIQLVDSLGRIGQHYANQQEQSQALPYFHRARDVHKLILTTIPNDVRRWHVFYTLLGQTAQAHLFLSEFEEARAYWGEAIQSVERMIELDPENARWKVDLAFAISQLGYAHSALREYDESIRLTESSIAILEELTIPRELEESVKESLEHRRLNLSEIRRCQLADGDWDALLAQPNKDLVFLLLIRCGLKSRDGNIEDIVRAAEKLEEIATLVPDDELNALRNAASGYAICAKLTVGWRPPALYPASNAPEPSAEDLQMQREFISKSILALEAAINRGYELNDWLREDPVFAALHGLPEFEALFPETPQ